MIQMRFNRGGVIDVPEDPAVISILQVHGFSQIEGRPANAGEVTLILGTEQITVPAEPAAIIDQIRAGARTHKVHLAAKAAAEQQEETDAR